MTVWIVFHRSSLASLSRVLSSKHLLYGRMRHLAKVDRCRRSDPSSIAPGNEKSLRDRVDARYGGESGG